MSRKPTGSRCMMPAKGFYRIILHYGFMEEVDVPRDLGRDRSLRRRAST